jgi:hypothetical protein
MSELYFSVDIESDGPIPGRNSMLSFGCAVFTDAGKMIETYTANLDTLSEATTDPNTMEWWKGQPEAWAACRKDTRPAEVVMPEFVQWVKRASSRDRPVFVGYPAGYDFTFMYWYMIAFAGESPFSFYALIDGRYVPARPLNGTRAYTGLLSRLKDAWAVFWCKAEAFKWPSGQ